MHFIIPFFKPFVKKNFSPPRAPDVFLSFRQLYQCPPFYALCIFFVTFHGCTARRKPQPPRAARQNEPQRRKQSRYTPIGYALPSRNTTDRSDSSRPLLTSLDSMSCCFFYFWLISALQNAKGAAISMQLPWYMARIAPDMFGVHSPAVGGLSAAAPTDHRLFSLPTTRPQQAAFSKSLRRMGGYWGFREIR